jgi:Nif-specific regulatory protein
MNKYFNKCFKSDLPVLLLGETGTGKSYYAKQIHQNSKNSHLKFIQINLASLSENLFESEVFGHTKGAFSGAIADKKGFCEEVGMGTLFLDEVGELSLQAQAKLLTLLDEKIFYSVGSTYEKKFRGRIIVATNKNIKKMIKEGTFREDLYYRLRLLEFTLPNLRDNYDLQGLIWNEIQNCKVRNQDFELVISNAALGVMNAYRWPGNYRELKNSIEYLLCIETSRIGVEELPRWIREGAELRYSGEESSYHDAMCIFEKNYLVKKLKDYAGRINYTAEMIGLNKVTLISKLKKYDIDRREYKHLSNKKKTYGF